MALVQKTFKKRSTDELEASSDEQGSTPNQGVVKLEQVVERPLAPLPVLIQRQQIFIFKNSNLFAY